MHPIEHLRHVARATGAEPADLAREAAGALAAVARAEPAGLVPACRRLVDRHVTAGPVWWLSARMLGSDDPRRAATDAVRELGQDCTDRHLASCLPEAATVLMTCCSEVLLAALRSRGDVEALVVDSGGDGPMVLRRLRNWGSDAQLVPESGVGPAAAACDLVVLEALAAGATGILAAPCSMAAAAVASRSAIPVWAVAGAGRVLPGRLWDALLARLDESGLEPWDRAAEVVAADLLSRVVGPSGPGEPEEMLSVATCPAAPELFRPAG